MDVTSVLLGLVSGLGGGIIAATATVRAAITSSRADLLAARQRRMEEVAHQTESLMLALQRELRFNHDIVSDRSALTQYISLKSDVIDSAIVLFASYDEKTAEQLQTLSVTISQYNAAIEVLARTEVGARPPMISNLDALAALVQNWTDNCLTQVERMKGIIQSSTGPSTVNKSGI